jgi:hypothetical protein
MKGTVLLACIAALAAGPPAFAAPAAAPAAPAAPSAPSTTTPAPADRAQIRLSLGERALLEWLKAASPYTVTVKASLFTTDLIFSDPSDLVLKDSRASFRIRVRGRTVPLDQVLKPVITLRYDARVQKYYVVVQSLPLQMPGLGAIDLKEFIPDWEVPPLVENFWRFSDKPVGMDLNVRRVAIIDHAIEIGADISFNLINPSGGRTGL